VKSNVDVVGGLDQVVGKTGAARRAEDRVAGFECPEYPIVPPGRVTELDDVTPFRIELAEDARERARAVLKLGGNWNRKQPNRGPRRSAINPKSLTSVAVRDMRLVCVMSSFTLMA
jgi:hypothetical protein